MESPPSDPTAGSVPTEGSDPTTGSDPEEWTHDRTSVGDVALHYVAAGDPDDPLVVLLHGFPEFWYAWRDQIDPFADAGFRVLAPDLRGYNRSEKPTGVEQYRLDRLVADVAGLLDHADRESAHVVGHDWGGVIAWEFAHRRPERVDRLAVLNAPHLDAFARELRTSSQALRSWYAGLFQVPWLPELILGRDYGWLGAMLRGGTVNPTAFDDRDVRRYEEAIARPGALTAALDYYRALFRTEAPRWLGSASGGGSEHETVGERGTDDGRTAGGRTVDAPTLVCWGERDPALGVGLTEGLGRWVPHVRVERFPDAGHWVQADAPERVNRHLRTFLGENS